MSHPERTAEMVEQWPHRVELNRSVKGEYGWSVTIRFDDARTYDGVTDDLQRIDNMLRQRFLTDEWEKKLEKSVEIARRGK